MAISSNTLFHFVGSLGALKDILQNSFFKPNYCLEYDKGKIEDDNFYAIPMVCFCDIPLSQISEHIWDYGHYAIGMSKKWSGNKVSPIIYYKDKESLAKTIFSQMNRKSKNQNDYKQSLLYFSLMKRYYGETWSISNKKGLGGYRKKVLYNEREWRFVPRTLKAKDLVLKVKDYNDLVSQPTNNEVSAVRLIFKIEDINFIIVDKEEERLPLIHHILTTFGDTDYVRVLCSKILTIKQIKENF